MWDPNGRSVIYVTGPESHREIARVSANGGQPTAVLSSSESRWEVVRLGYSPDGRWITFETLDRAVFAVPAARRNAVRTAEGHESCVGSVRSAGVLRQPAGS